MNTRTRLAALDKAAAVAGKTRDEIFASVAHTWNLDTGELFAIRQAMANMPAPAVAKQEDTDHTTAVQLELERQRIAQDAHAIATYRTYVASDSITKAAMLNTSAELIYHGQHLDSK